jgi:hypothetical protein
METNQRWRTYLFAFLIICVCSSSHILIYNEELIVVLTFFLFLAFLSNYFANTFKESLDERSEGIRAELQNFFLLKKNSLDQLYQQHDKVFHLPSALKDLNRFTGEGLSQGLERGKNALFFTLSQQMAQKCTTLAVTTTSPSGTELPLENRLSRNQLGSVLYHLENKKGKGLPMRQSWDRSTIERGIKLLQKKESR